MSLKKSYVALAWTRPVPWAGFDRLSSDIDAAAMQSRTIRYQRDLIRQYVREVQGVLETEVVLLELAPDRATPESLKILGDLVRKCSSQATVEGLLLLTHDPLVQAYPGPITAV